ncbi:hypothetical protein [Pelagerythrobacter marensis]|uniref:Uncharacterized protein n=1 Tax=Pelagerythrobacter marensis TaxID=543877 RepID=A0A0G3X8F5_9SPHN|nr:hypothetical protein [Pelagerythrobacter marensis]AKM06911.1 hypothetical protein AM2010_833 [Pelagerythrobacter marensis]
MIDEVVWAGLEKAKAHKDFESGSWLTFYLAGQPENLRKSFPELKLMNAENLDGEEGGFLYPKIPVELERSDIEEKIMKVCSIADRLGLNNSIIDLDACPEVEQSKFFTLWTAAN